MEFRFGHPWLLLLLLILPTLWVWQQLAAPAAVKYAPARLFEHGLKLRRSIVPLAQKLLVYAAAACLLLGLAKPQSGVVSAEVRASGIDIMILLDVSRSMLAEDYSIGAERASRIEVVKQVTEKFIQNRPNDRIGIIAFAGRPFLVSPLTLDHAWLLANLSRLQIGLTEDGTAIGSALVSAANRLRDLKAKSRVIILLTDGDNNAGKVPPFTAAEAAAGIGIRIYTIGAGTNGLVPFPETDRFGNKFYTEEYMPFQEDTCRQIAKIGHGEFFRAIDTRSMQEIFASIDRLEKTEMSVQKVENYEDLFPWFVGVGLGLVGIGTVLGETIWRRIP
jgi:Ca-activated chloride channel homolog